MKAARRRVRCTSRLREGAAEGDRLGCTLGARRGCVFGARWWAAIALPEMRRSGLAFARGPWRPNNHTTCASITSKHELVVE